MESLSIIRIHRKRGQKIDDSWYYILHSRIKKPRTMWNRSILIARIFLIFWILWINHLDQIIWIKLIWIKLSGSNYLDQIIIQNILQGVKPPYLYQNILQGVKPYIKIYCKESNLISKYSKYSIIYATHQNIKNSQMQILILWIMRNFSRSISTDSIILVRDAAFYSTKSK